MHTPKDRRLKAVYDEFGNIVLRAEEDSQKPISHVEQTGMNAIRPLPLQLRAEPVASKPTVGLLWEECIRDTEDTWEIDRNVLVTAPKPDPTAYVKEMLGSLRDTTHSALAEGMRQYTESAAHAAPIVRDVRASGKRGVRLLWEFLAQPVWVPGKNKSVKEYSRGTLFVLDIARFGTTFAFIFAVLFVGMNYQSFWEIASSNITKLVSGASLTTQASVFASHTRKEGDLISYLPTVGPPDNRIVIPKLGLNVPLVQPSTAALLRQDWTQVEADIQKALEDGVVHYPGTARPGQAGNFFVTGHSSYYAWGDGDYKTVFARLHELAVGDEYIVYYGGDEHRYIVRSKTEVLPSDVTVLDQPADARMATLMTCTPIGTTLRRLIVRAEEVDLVTGEPLRVGERTGENLPERPALEALPI